MTSVKWVALEGAPVWHMVEAKSDGSIPICGMLQEERSVKVVSYQPDGSARCRQCIQMEGIL